MTVKVQGLEGLGLLSVNLELLVLKFSTGKPLIILQNKQPFPGQAEGF